jgi:hypothetical protein
MHIWIIKEKGKKKKGNLKCLQSGIANIKVEYKVRKITKDKKECGMMIKGTIHQ